jgi:hypothetical protein
LTFKGFYSIILVCLEKKDLIAMFKLFKRKTEEEKQLEFIERYKAPSYNLEKLCEVISSTPRPFEISEWVEHDTCLTGYKQVKGNIYQEAYIAVSEDACLFITTNRKGTKAYAPFTIIYSVDFPREGQLRRCMARLSRTYMMDLEHLLKDTVNVEVEFQTNYFRELFLVFN